MKRFFRRLRFWLFQRGKGCKHCCLICGYYDLCSYDFRTRIEDAAAAFDDLTTTAAKTAASTQALSEALKKASSGN